MNKFEKMSKEDLRAAAKAVGIKYGKMNNTQMREALAMVDLQKNPTKTPKATPLPPLPAAERDVIDEIFADLAVPRDAPVAPAPLKTNSDQTAATSTERAAVASVVAKSKKGLKIEKDREERNGVKRPSVGGACRIIWDALDARVAIGNPVDAKVVKELAVANSWNPNNASIEFYQWRKFNGITSKK